MQPRRPVYFRSSDDLPMSPEYVERARAQRQVLSCDDKDNAVRWKEGERLNHLFENSCERFGRNAAVDAEDTVLTYRELDERANRVARHLIDRGIRAGDRVGLLFDKTVETYVALLAVMKVNAAYVPLDPGFPTERIRFIVADADLTAIVSMSDFADRLSAFDVRKIFLDVAKRDIDAKSPARLADGEVAPPADRVCYIIYTSGTTGNPKGVAVEHPAICNFVRVAAELYGFVPGDRVHQGMSIAFDFSVEEIWVPLIAGATLVPGEPGASLIGDELADFLRDRRVTCLCCCPTLLATIEQELPQLRILLVGGEACPQNLVARWHRPGRTILNSYGPTEATVTATLSELTPNKPVTIGGPLPTYSIVILDPVADRAVARGELGEIGIAGIGLAAGYVNRDDLTREKFIADFLDIPNNPSQRIYRTGDLGRINLDDEIEYLGRIDTQVKIRGHRIELVEIESVLLELPQIAQAAVTTYEPEPGMVELVAYYSLKQGAGDLPRSEITRALRKRLPASMVPAFLEQLPFIPMLISNKADHKKLPKPKRPQFLTGNKPVAANTEKEHILAQALAEALKVDRVSVEDHFFNDLGAHSLLMARFCAGIRKNPALSNVSMRDIYQYPTVAKLAEHLEHAADESFIAGKQEPFHVPSDFSYYGCGALQLLFYAGYGLLVLWISATGLTWTYAAIDDPLALYLRSTAFAVAAFAGLTALPIAAKWLLIGRWKPESFPIWSLRYYRFWMIKTLVQSAPVAAFRGSPIHNLYLRLLGAKIGRGTVINARFVPVCTDLFSVGDDTVLRKDSILLGYRAQGNFIHTGPIAIGSHAFVGEASVLDIDTAMGNRSQLGHASSLQSGQRVPDGKHYHGSPAIETKADYCPIESKRCTSLRRGLYSGFQLAGMLAILIPLPIMLLDFWYPYFAPFAGETALPVAGSTMAFVSLMLLASAGSFFGLLALGLAGIYLVPRLCQRLLVPGKTYVLYGFHYWLQRVVSLTSNSQFYNLLFGDTSGIVHYMRFVGWKLNEVEQTGSNFGTNQKHDNPFLCEIGSKTMVSDGLSMINLQMSSSSFRLAATRIGECNYLGNDIHYPPDGRTGANCLLGTKVLIPIDGPVRENVGLLGSPCFEIPRSVDRDKNLSAAFDGEARRQRLRRKNAHNLLTAALLLLTRWMFFFMALLASHLAVLYYPDHGVGSLFVAGALISLAAIPYFAFIERASIGFKRLEPKLVSIYDPYFWAHERHWKLSDSPIVELFKGTPFKNWVTRLVGVKIGRKVYDGGCCITDRTLTEIGDHSNLNEGSVLQSHSLEEGVFKSDHIRLSEGCTLGAAAFVHYGVIMGDRAVLDADSFLMKGEVLDQHSCWRGNPAKLFRRNTPHDQSVARVAANERAPARQPLESFVACVAAE
ncbi:MAG: amino acid adenylation domain-containing protein [Rhizobiales bacterium]|nr:amino acid adenylation domain-containing protein [Hyphomicrobiales bacterium]